MAHDLSRALGIGLLLALMTHLPDHLAAMDRSAPVPRPALFESVQGAD